MFLLTRPPFVSLTQKLVQTRGEAQVCDYGRISTGIFYPQNFNLGSIPSTIVPTSQESWSGHGGLRPRKMICYRAHVYMSQVLHFNLNRGSKIRHFAMCASCKDKERTLISWKLVSVLKWTLHLMKQSLLSRNETFLGDTLITVATSRICANLVICVTTGRLFRWACWVQCSRCHTARVIRPPDRRILTVNVKHHQP